MRRIAISLLIAAGLIALATARFSALMAFPPLALCGLWVSVMLVLATLYRPCRRPVPEGLSVGVVIPVYNEDPASFAAALSALGQQSRLPDVVWVVDDGSEDFACHKLARLWESMGEGLNAIAWRKKDNGGKRSAQLIAFRGDPTIDIWVTVDSDAVLDPHAIEEILRPFSNPKVMGVAGAIRGLNWKRNWLTRIVDVEFTDGFLVGRNALSTLGAVTVTCGALAAYRGDVVRAHLDEYEEQSFLGAKVSAGDDRHLTQLCLLHGQVVSQDTATAATLLPDNLSFLARQRLRWGASFYRGVTWVLGRLGPKDVAWWVIVFQSLALAGFLAAIVWALTHGSLSALAHYAAAAVILGYLRSLPFLFYKRPDMTFRQQVGSWLRAPMVGLLYLVLLTPIQFGSVLWVRRDGWLTRKKVEVGV